VPAVAYRDSCIFHGSRCLNSYFCGDLGTFLKSRDPKTPTVVIAGEGEEMRTSPVLMP
jgi:hypothetical protein